MSAFYAQLPMNTNVIILNCEWKHMSMCRGLWGPNVMQWKKAFLTITSDLPAIYTAFLKHAHSLTHISHTTPYTSLGSRGAKRPSENINKAMRADNHFLPCVNCLYPLLGKKKMILQVQLTPKFTRLYKELYMALDRNFWWHLV